MTLDLTQIQMYTMDWLKRDQRRIILHCNLVSAKLLLKRAVAILLVVLHSLFVYCVANCHKTCYLHIKAVLRDRLPSQESQLSLPRSFIPPHHKTSVLFPDSRTRSLWSEIEAGVVSRGVADCTARSSLASSSCALLPILNAPRSVLDVQRYKNITLPSGKTRFSLCLA